MNDDQRIILATVKENVSLTAFDAATGEVLAVVPVGEPEIAKPHEVTVTADGRLPLCPSMVTGITVPILPTIGLVSLIWNG